ncbi:MAG: 50S ribosomal protein L25/general stress protein Ctc [Bacteroidales bacterium]|jgi:large subunit ribosomal protein L25|nr:50S ribosomal protein L25/general stress protein Ctc [Bacteroidales bacterium]
MKSIEISGSQRSGLGKKETKKLRAENKVPCVLYGGKEVIHFYAEDAEFRKLIYTSSVYVVDLSIDGTKKSAILQDAQFHPVEERILHCDFLEINPEKPIKIEIPVKIEGYAKGERAGGKKKLNLRRLKVKGLVQHIPDNIAINVDDLDVGQSVRVGQLKYDNLEFLNTKSVPVVTITVTRAARAAMSAAPTK